MTELRYWWFNFREDGAARHYLRQLLSLCWLRGHDMHEHHAYEEGYHNPFDCWAECSRCDYGYDLHVPGGVQV